MVASKLLLSGDMNPLVILKVTFLYIAKYLFVANNHTEYEASYTWKNGL